MKTIKIKAKDFFELLKNRDTSMWSIFAQMIQKDQEQVIIFLNEKEEEITRYILPTNETQLKEDQKVFAEEFKRKLQ